MATDTIQTSVLSWVLTYALHSSAFLAAAWCVTRRLRAGSERAQELLWKTALVGGLVTASLQVGLNLEPLAGRFAVEPSPIARTIAEPQPTNAQPSESEPAKRTQRAPETPFLAWLPSPMPGLPTLFMPRGDTPARPASRTSQADVPITAEAPPRSPHRPAVEPEPKHASAGIEPCGSSAQAEPCCASETGPLTVASDCSESAPASEPARTVELPEEPEVGAAVGAVAGLLERPPLSSNALSSNALSSNARSAFAGWSDALLLLVFAGGTLGVLLLLVALKRLADRLAGRRVLTEGPLFELFVALCEHADVPRRPRLCVSTRLDSPATVGVLAPMVCVPERALTELEPEHQEAMLAHELAHVSRRDPQWAFFARLLERALFFQPLNGLARRRLSVLSEYLADEWAVEQTGRGLSLARCLTEVAGWLVERRAQVGVLPMAAQGSLLGARVRRLLTDDPNARRARSSRLARVTWSGAGLLLVGGVAFVLPGAAASAAAQDEAPLDGALLEEAPLEPELLEVTHNRAQIMQSLLDELDAEVDELLLEIEALDLTLDDSELSDSFAQPVEVLRGRLERLRESKSRLDLLAPAVLEMLEQAPREPLDPAPQNDSPRP